MSWDQVWRLYLDYRTVFGRAIASLRARGAHIDADRATDLVQQFLVYRAASALETFQADRGQLENWLFVVFRRFVLDELVREKRVERLLKSMASDPQQAAPSEQDERVDTRAVQRAIANLPRDQRLALELVLQDGQSSIRAAARILGKSRWETRQLIVDGIHSVADFIGAEPSFEEERRSMSAELLGSLRRMRNRSIR